MLKVRPLTFNRIVEPSDYRTLGLSTYNRMYIGMQSMTQVNVGRSVPCSQGRGQGRNCLLGTVPVLLSSTKVLLLEHPRGPIYKSLSLSLHHRVLENFQILRILQTVRYV